MHSQDHVDDPFRAMFFSKKIIWPYGATSCLRLRLDVWIGGYGIELGSIPNQPWYWNEMRFQFYCLDVIALAFRILGKNSNQFSVWMYKRIELVFVLLRPGPIRPSSARRSSMPPSSRRRRAQSPGRGGVARRRLRGRDGATRCCCFCRGARARGRAAAARAGDRKSVV